MRYPRVNQPKFKAGDIITYFNGERLDIVTGHIWFRGSYKYCLFNERSAYVDELYIDQKIGEADFLDNY